MNKFRKFLISGLAVCAIGCTAAGFAACGEDAVNYPDFRRPVDYVEPGGDGDGDTNGEFKGDYTIAVMTAGGLRINNVKVEVKLPGESLNAISKDNGEIKFRAEPGEYEIVVDEGTLPTGYFIGNEKFKTSATSGNAVVTISSKVMANTAVSSYRYALGDVMYNFSYTDNNGDRQVLSELLAEGSQYKAVVLNFWYIGCGPCRDEFPALQSAYENYSDKVKLIAVSTSDSQSAIDTFRKENNYTFDMVQDFSNISSLFSITATPTTVVIDRYGVFVSSESGKVVDSRIWSSKFSHYVSDNYVQEAPSEDEPGGDTGDVTQRVDPDVPEDDYTKFPALLNGNGADGKVIEYYGATTESDKKYNWPWISDAGAKLGRPHVKTTNSKVGNSFAILTVTVSLEAGDYISYDYFTSSEAGQDILYVLVDGEIVAEHSGDSRENNTNAYGWITKRAAYTASRKKTVSLSFCYLKDELEDTGDDYAAISNIAVSNVKDATAAIDMRLDACSGEVDSTGEKYTDYVTPYFNESDNYYHVRYESGKDSILFLDMLNTTAWSDLHIGKPTFRPISHDAEQVAAFYYLIYWDHTNWKDDASLQLTFGGNEAERLTEIYITSYYMNLFSANELVPVSKDIKELIETFLIEYCKIENVQYHDNMWLEFCCYFKHYGINDHPDEENCNATTDSTKGMDFINAYSASIGNNSIDVWNLNTIDGGGMVARFVPDKSGVYKFTSINSQAGDDPRAILYNSQHDNIAAFDNLVCYDLFLRPDTADFEGYAYLNAGEVYYLRVYKGYQTMGTVNYNIEYIGDSYDELRVATTGDGMWSYNEELGIGFSFYLAIDVYLYPNDNCYYHIDRNGDRGSVVYIDFIHPNFYEDNNHSLYWIVENGYFNFSSFGGPDMTAKMLEFYNKAVDKDENDETYGMIEASRELVNLLTTFIEVQNGEKPETKFWLSFATYYEHYGK